MRLDWLGRDHGYTLVETSIAIVLTVFVTGLVYAGYGRTQKAITSWNRSMRATNVAHIVGRRVATDIRSAHQAETQPGELRLIGETQTVVYRWGTSSLQRGKIYHNEGGSAVAQSQPPSFQDLSSGAVQIRVSHVGFGQKKTPFAETVGELPIVTFKAEVVDTTIHGKSPTGVPIRVVSHPRPGRGMQWLTPPSRHR